MWHPEASFPSMRDVSLWQYGNLGRQMQTAAFSNLALKVLHVQVKKTLELQT